MSSRSISTPGQPSYAQIIVQREMVSTGRVSRIRVLMPEMGAGGSDDRITHNKGCRTTRLRRSLA